MLARAGAPGSRLKVNVWAGLSASVAEAVKVKRRPSLIVLLLRGARTGAMLGWEIPIMPDERETGMITRFPSADSTGVGELSIEKLLIDPSEPSNWKRTKKIAVPSLRFWLSPLESSQDRVSVPLFVMVVPKFPVVKPASPNDSTPT